MNIGEIVAACGGGLSISMVRGVCNGLCVNDVATMTESAAGDVYTIIPAPGFNVFPHGGAFYVCHNEWDVADAEGCATRSDAIALSYAMAAEMAAPMPGH